MVYADSSGRNGLSAGIFLISLALLLVELVLTRIFSVIMFHHFFNRLTRNTKAFFG